MPASQCASGAAPAISATGTAEEPPQSPMQSEAPGQTQGPAGVPLPLSSHEDDESMDFSNSRKRLREESRDEDDHAPHKRTATTPSESSNGESHASQGSEMSGSECRTMVDSEGTSTTADMTSSATTGGPDPASSDEGSTESPDNPPSDASAAMKVVEEVLTRTATGGNTRKEAPYTAKDFLLTSSAGATHTNRRKKGKKKRTKKQPPATASEGTAANLPKLPARPPLQWTPQASTAVQRGVLQTWRASRDLAAAAVPPGRPCHCGNSSLPAVSPRRYLQWIPTPDPRTGALCKARRGPQFGVTKNATLWLADTTTRECLEQLLTIKELKGILVTAKEPADHKTSTGVPTCVDGEPAADSLLPGIQSAVPVLSDAREGRTVTLRFAGPVADWSTCHSSWSVSQCGQPDPALCNVGNVVGSAM
ncbi:hypothetical protein HPB51_027660 [Rhipicephalus microplus]|uniref:Uncharacterized protein n=1 Tax=Rhipicephalus microplus TaxID=6941 RepID=A0A9J6CZE3_RHIMP|nr:hypothetical protein HPB51_027660 [Rhipicephalus microplus]